VLARAGGLLVYPAPGCTADLDSLVAQAAGCDAEAGRALEAFDGWARGQSTEAMQEAFTQTFDLNPVCALEVGWQLFGEEYERGAFMVHMRQLLRDHAVPEGGELPDHLSSLLAVLPRLARRRRGDSRPTRCRRRSARCSRPSSSRRARSGP
jgi:nitrate reductase delta subunit